LKAEKKAKLKKYISSKEIKARVKKLAAKINRDYKDKTPIIIGILNGSFIFMADLIRELEIDCEVDFLKLSSYGDEKITSGKIKMLKELNCEIHGRDILVVEDIIDSGLSVKFIKDIIEKEKPSSLRFASLLYKKDIAKLDFSIDYIGFKIDNKFVIGYGLDFAQKFRNLKGIYVLYN
jgi:hypoxanthine phosphoribosyltransferase